MLALHSKRVAFSISVVVRHQKALQSICQQAWPGSFDSAQ
jgi:hypothetical protein